MRVGASPTNGVIIALGNCIDAMVLSLLGLIRVLPGGKIEISEQMEVCHSKTEPIEHGRQSVAGGEKAEMASTIPALDP